MVSLSWIDLHYLGKEITSELKRSKIENIYGNHEELHIKLYKSGQKNSFISSFLNKGILLMNNEKYQHNSKNIFIQFLRKKLKNGVFECCFTYEKERIVTLRFSVKNHESNEFEVFYLHIELFMGGQVTICNEKNVIIRQLKQLPNLQDSQSHTYKLFDSKINELDVVNKLGQKLDTNNDLDNHLLIKKDEVLKNITLEQIDTTKNLQDSLKFLGIGKKYIEYLEQLYKIENKVPLKNIEPEKLTCMIIEISNLLEYSNSTTLLNSKNLTSPLLLPFNPKTKNSQSLLISNLIEFEDCDTLFSLKLKELYKEHFIPKSIDKKEPAKLIKLKKRLEDQEKNLKKINSQSDKLELQANSFYTYYQELQELQNKINLIIKEENGFNLLKEKRKNNLILKKIITQVSEKDKSVSINTNIFEELKNKNT